MKTYIDFLFNGTPIHIDFDKEKLSPTTTLLNWSRSNGHEEVKEGCAEGDCGACTVVIAEAGADDKLHYKAVNSCIVFLPSLDGKLVITASGLVPETYDIKQLHDVQKAIVENHATQCGFCTPGFVMSIFALYHTPDIYTTEKINNALAGNLCRCTGYDSIRKAAHSVLSKTTGDFYSKNEAQLIQSLRNIQLESIDIQVNNQRYLLPRTLSEALVLRQNFPIAEIINGSTDIALKQSKHFMHLPFILDLSAVNELKVFEKYDESLHIGAGLDLESIRQMVEKTFPAFYEILCVFASRQIRNVASIGGSIGSASPIGDILPLLMAMNGKIILKSLQNERVVNVDEYVISYRKTVINNDEIILKIIIPLPDAHEFVKMYKVSKRTDMDISTLSAAFRLKLNAGLIQSISAVYGGMAATTQHATEAESFLIGKKWCEENMQEAVKIIENTFSPISDARSGAEFRSMAAGNLLRKFYEETKLSQNEK